MTDSPVFLKSRFLRLFSIMLLPPGVPDFKILPAGPVSAAFLAKGCTTFTAATQWIRQLPYRRISNRNVPLLVLSEGKGTCSTKHALLHQLTAEQGQSGFILMIGVFAMNAGNTPRVAGVLQEHGLDAIPEAHCYLRYEDAVLDCTRQRSSGGDFMADLLTEFPIQPQLAGDYKEQLHRQYLSRWLSGQESLQHLTLHDLWRIREQCIKSLS